MLGVERAPVVGGDQSGRQRNKGKCIPGKVGMGLAGTFFLFGEPVRSCCNSAMSQAPLSIQGS